MQKFYKVIATVFLGIALMLSLGAATFSTDVPQITGNAIGSTVVEDSDNGGVKVADPGLLEQLGPPGAIVSAVVGGALLIIRAINDGKKIDVTTYKERAADAESRSDAEIGKVHRKLEELEQKLDAVIADRDQYRNTLEDKKAEWTEQFLEQGRRHQIELESLHAALVSEIHIRHKLERILAENNIITPETPPPYTPAMRNDATAAEEQEATLAAPPTASLPIILPD